MLRLCEHFIGQFQDLVKMMPCLFSPGLFVKTHYKPRYKIFYALFSLKDKSYNFMYAQILHQRVFTRRKLKYLLHVENPLHVI